MQRVDINNDEFTKISSIFIVNISISIYLAQKYEVIFNKLVISIYQIFNFIILESLYRMFVQSYELH